MASTLVSGYLTGNTIPLHLVVTAGSLTFRLPSNTLCCSFYLLVVLCLLPPFSFGLLHFRLLSLWSVKRSCLKGVHLR